jgi:hypothetical protein
MCYRVPLHNEFLPGVDPSATKKTSIIYDETKTYSKANEGRAFRVPLALLVV